MSLLLRDKLNLFSKLTPRRSFNALKIWSSYHLSKLTKTNLHIGMPVSISIEPTTSCNLRCPECPSGLRTFNRPTGMLEKDFFKKTINELSKDIFFLTFYFQGEPYLNPSFLEMVKHAHQKKIYTSTSTNAHYLGDDMARRTVESGLDRLIISIDGTTQETYQMYRIGGELNKVLEGAKNILKWKKKLKSKTPHVIFQFLVVRPNEHQVADLMKMGSDLGIEDVRFKTAQVYDYENGNVLIPMNEKYSRYKKNTDGTYSIKNKLENHCWKMWQSCVITWDGKIVPCCFDKDASHQLGNLKEKKFKDVWKSKEYNNFRASVLHTRSSIDICKNCSEGTVVWT